MVRGPRPLRLGFLPQLGMPALSAFVEGARRQDPELQVKVTHAHSGAQLRLLQRDELDAGILRLVNTVPGIESEPLWPGTPMTAFIAAGHPLATKPAIAPSDVAGQDMTIYPRTLGAAGREWWAHALADAGFAFRRVVSGSGSHPHDLVAQVVHDGGIALATLDFVPSATLGTLAVARPLDALLPVPPTVLAWSARRTAELAAARAAAHALRRHPLAPAVLTLKPLPRQPTTRELEVLQLAADGLSAPLIAERLTISTATVRSHFDNAYRKLGAADRASAIAVALRHGLIV